ncbi:hypothetical protein MY3296_004770 [Beauveria thailandica]
MYQAYVASESGNSCQRSGDSPRLEPADYWDKEEQDHWPDDSSGAISSDDSASVRQRQQTSPPPVRYYSSPPRHQRRSKPPSSVLSDDDSSYGPQGHRASRSPHGHQESYGCGGRVHPVVKPFAPHRHRFTRAPALSGEHGDGYYAPGYRQTSGYSQPLRVSHGNPPSSTTDDRQAGEEDDVVQLKAVWVSDPSRVDPESSRKSEEEQSGKEVRVEKPDDEASRPHESKARGQSKVPFTNATITKLPFFNWKTSLCDTKDDSMKERHQDWMKLPSPVPSPMDDLLSHCAEEHMSVALPTDVGGPTEMTSRTAVEYGTFILTHDGDEDEDDENRSVQTPVSSSCHVPSKSETGPNIDFETRRQAARKIREPSRKHVKDAVRVEPKMLADPSTDIFGLFIPAELRTNHPLTERYWGSLDRIFRQIKFAMEDIDSKRRQKWCIRQFLITPNPIVKNGESSKPPPMAFGDCADCTKSCTYSSAYEALSHIHRLHTNCPGEGRYKHAFDDPCYVWLRATYRKHDGRRYNEIARLTRNFTSELRGLCRRATDLQLAVASVEGANSASVSMPSSSSTAPSLTKDLVDAFEDIVMAHIIKAKHLSLANQWMFDGDDPNNRGAGASPAPAGSARRIPSAEFLTKVEDMIRCGAECLDHARTNLILLSTRTAMGAKISLDYIGIEFLVAVLVGKKWSKSFYLYR